MRIPNHVHARTAGFTLLELVVMSTLFLVALLAFSRSTRGAVDLGTTSQESAVAVEAARAALEGLGAVPFDELYARLNTDPDDDPDGPGTAPGPNFAVDGLDARPGDADGMVGAFVLPEEAAGGASELREDVQNAEIGMPRDLNLDGTIDTADHSADYKVLPVMVRLEWQGRTGPRIFTARTILTER